MSMMIYSRPIWLAGIVLPLCVVHTNAHAQAGAYYLRRIITGNEGSQAYAGAPPAFHAPQAVAVDAAGNLFVADTGNNIVDQINANGKLVTQITTAGLFNPPSSPDGIAFGPTGNVLVCYQTNSLPSQLYFYAYNRSNRQFQQYDESPYQTAAPPLLTARIATDTNGVLAILYVDGNGHQFIQAYGTPDAPLRPAADAITDLVAWPSGGFLTLTSNGVIQRLDDSLQPAAPPITVTQSTYTPGSYNGLAVDANGNLYVTETTHVLACDPTGKAVAILGDATGGSGRLQFNAPAGIAVNAAGDIFVADTGNNRIEEYSPVGPRDFDIHWQNQQTRDLVDWSMFGSQMQGSAILAQGLVPDWRVAAYTDLYGAGQAGLVWQNDATGDVVYWWMSDGERSSGERLFSGAQLDPDWRLAAAVDLNEDGNPDFIWQSRTSGDVVYWLMNGLQVVARGYLAQGVDRSWRLVGLADLNGDGVPDLVWQNTTTADVAYWLLADNQTGFSVTVTGFLAQSLDRAWRLETLTDINGDGHADLLFHNSTTGAVAYWLLNGTDVTGTGALSNVDPAWRAVGES